MGSLIDLTGKRFGKLVVLKRGENLGHHIGWLCQCECGNKKTINVISLKTGRTKSCGCGAYENRLKNCSKRLKHGGRFTGTWMSWRAMRGRCLNSSASDFGRYGGRGLTICKRWDKFEEFLKDMGARPDGKTLDRINNEKGYSPENCRWATLQEQAWNKRSTRWIRYKSVEKPLKVWADEYGMCHSTLARRLEKGLSVEDALLRPKQMGRSLV